MMSLFNGASAFFGLVAAFFFTAFFSQLRLISFSPNFLEITNTFLYIHICISTVFILASEKVSINVTK